MPLLKRWFPNGEWLVLLALLAEVAIFSVVAQNFFTTANLVEVLRFSVELGLLALALTPVIITGGIDLSVGSMMGLCAVIFGSLVMDWHWPVTAAIILTLAVGCIGGSLNGVLIARYKIPPLIVTLGSFSAFRGIAEGITHGAVNYSGFPKSFLFLGQGYLLGVPAQLPVFVIALAAYAILLHRSVIGRALYAIGFTGDGARWAGIDVARRTGLVYFLAGLSASIAAVIYVAHLGQAKSDAGTGYELDAITAVVLGGASVAGGRGTILGTILGLFSISVLQNGLHLAALPSELTGILTGTVLVLTIAFDRLRARGAITSEGDKEEMKNSQLAILCGAILAGALITAGSNVWLVRFVEARSGRSHYIRAHSGDRRDAESQRRSLLCQLPHRRGGSGERTRRRIDLGWAYRPGRGQAERDCRELDHARRRCHRGRRGESSRHLHCVAKSPCKRDSRAHLGR